MYRTSGSLVTSNDVMVTGFGKGAACVTYITAAHNAMAIGPKHSDDDMISRGGVGLRAVGLELCDIGTIAVQILTITKRPFDIWPVQRNSGYHMVWSNTH